MRGEMGETMALVVPCAVLSLSMAAGALLRHAVAADRLFQQPEGGRLSAALREQKVTRVALCVNFLILKIPDNFDFNRGLIAAPAPPHGPLLARQRFCPPRTVCDDPARDGRLVEQTPTRCQECFDMPRAQRLRDIPAHPPQKDGLGDMGPRDTDRPGRAPSGLTVDHRGRSYRTSPQMNIATKPAGCHRVAGRLLLAAFIYRVSPPCTR